MLTYATNELVAADAAADNKAPFTRYNLLSSRFDKHSTGCQTRLTTGFTNGCIVYTAGCIV